MSDRDRGSSDQSDRSEATPAGTPTVSSAEVDDLLRKGWEYAKAATANREECLYAIEERVYKLRLQH